MNFSWEDFLERHKEWIVSEWGKKLKHDVSIKYNLRTSEELFITTSKAYQAFSDVITEDNYDSINEFIDEITKIRLETGFHLDDVQKAFELYREIIIPALVEESPRQSVCKNIESVNTILAYTIHRFSKQFQEMHETYLKQYANQLEKDVETRTAQLKASEVKYKTLVEDISDGYLVLDKEKINFVNPAFYKMHGYQPDDNIPKSFMSFVADESRDKVMKIITRDIELCMNTDAFEYKRLTKAGEQLPTEINFRPSLFRGKNYYLCIVRDITKRVEMERKNRETERMAYIGKLTTSLSHELRNPLSSIKMNLQILNKNIMWNGNDRERINISEKEIIRLENILQELLSFAKPISLKRSFTDINHIIYSCIELLEMKFYRKSIDHVIDVDKKLKKIFVDKARIEQVIINLLLNAIDSVDDKGRIIVSTGRVQNNDTDYFSIKVEDNGRGISEKALGYIFKSFYTTKTKGTGLGLSNVKRIVEAHSGMIKVSEAENSGAVFEVLIPMEKRDD